VAGATEIGVLANTVGLRRTGSHTRSADPGHVRTLPVIDNTLPGSENVRTSVDCYVSGQYLQRNGQAIEVTQRYSIFVSYSKQTQFATMKELSDRIASDFSARYGSSFNITTIYVPDLPAPIEKEQPQEGSPIEFYAGSKLFKARLGDYARMRLDVEKEYTKERVNIRSIRSRYGYGKR